MSRTYLPRIFTKARTSVLRFCGSHMHSGTLPALDLDWTYLCNVDNLDSIRRNIRARKGVGDINKVLALWNAVKDMDQHNERYAELKEQLLNAASDLPNRTHPKTPLGNESCARQIELCGQPAAFTFRPKPSVQIGESMKLLLTQNTGCSSGPRSYYLINELAHLENALVQRTMDLLKTKYGFIVVSVPNLVRSSVIERCGFKTTGERTQVFQVKQKNLSLAGTGEFPLAGFFINQTLNEEDLPLRVATVSHCYRAEVSDLARESGIYRVHQFTKVEMFAVTEDLDGSFNSDQVFREFVSIQKDLFGSLGLHFRVLDMPSEELGASAYCKVDIEAWLPAKQFWGEISSTSNCTDFQSRRLGIKYKGKDGLVRHCHTVNGTACAVPRMIIAILENYQQEDGSVVVPEVLRKYLNKQTVFKRG